MKKKKHKATAIHHKPGHNYWNVNGQKDIRTAPSSEQYRSNYDRIFRKDKKDDILHKESTEE